MSEIARRIGLVVGIPIALVMLAVPASDLIAVRLAKQVHGANSRTRMVPPATRRDAVLGNDFSSSGESADGGGLATETVGPTEDEAIRVRGREWEKLALTLSREMAGDSRGAAWHFRRSRSDASEDLYFHKSELPLGEVAKWVAEPGEFKHVLIEDLKPPRHLTVTAVSPFGVAYFAPDSLAFPYRHTAFWLLLAILVPYVAIPWPTAAPLGITYASRGQTLAADCAGTILYAGFIGVWAMLLFSPSGPANDFSGVLIVTIIFWGFALGGLSIYAVAVWYATKRLELRGEQLVYSSLLGTKEYSLSTVQSVDIRTHRRRVAMWFKVLGGLMSLLNWRAIAPTLLLRTEDDRLRFRFSGGEEILFSSLTLPQVGPLLGAMRSQGTLIEDSVYEHLDCDPTDSEFNSSSRAKTGSLVGVYFVVGIMAVLLAYGLIRTIPPRLPTLADVPLEINGTSHGDKQSELFPPRKKSNFQFG